MGARHSTAGAFVDRTEAGRLLAPLLAGVFDADELELALVLGLQRGGVPVAAQVAALLHLPLDVLIVRKLGAPEQPEYAIGAIAEEGSAYIDRDAARACGASDEVLAQLIARETARMNSYRERYRSARPLRSVQGRHVIVVDDGLATGLTALAAGRYLRAHGALSTTLAVPIAAHTSIERLRAGQEYDRCICLHQSEQLIAVGAWYGRFEPPTDTEITQLLNTESKSDARAHSAGSARAIPTDEPRMPPMDTNPTARDLMADGCLCVNEDDTLVTAAKLMDQQGIGALPICGTDGKLHGMLTDRDIVIKCLAQDKDPGSCLCSEFAEGSVVWIRDDASADEVLAMMEQHQVRRLPVIDADKRLVGIISQGDIARELDHEHAGELVEQVSKGPAQQHPVGA